MCLNDINLFNCFLSIIIIRISLGSWKLALDGWSLAIIRLLYSLLTSIKVSLWLDLLLSSSIFDYIDFLEGLIELSTSFWRRLADILYLRLDSLLNYYFFLFRNLFALYLELHLLTFLFRTSFNLYFFKKLGRFIWTRPNLICPVCLYLAWPDWNNLRALLYVLNWWEIDVFLLHVLLLLYLFLFSFIHPLLELNLPLYFK